LIEQLCVIILPMTRKYEQRRRAEKQDETRQRIVAAAVELHGTLGPARTSMSAVAERAGVQRNTLYRHFPDERSLLHACSAHYAGEHPPPAVDGWDEIVDPVERTRHGLRSLYGYWEVTEEMTTLVLRDLELNPTVREVNELHWGDPLARIRGALLGAWPGRPSKRLAAAVDLAMSFRTWQSLVRGSGLASRAAADLMAESVACAAQKPIGKPA
jgi:AcrR family transcriptional regulator